MARRCHGAVLELAAGTGRVSLPLAAAGLPLVALDRDVAMVRAMVARRPGPTWPLALVADMRDFALVRGFGLIFVAYNSFQLLTDAIDRADCLASVRRHLAPGGVFGLEVTDFQAGAADGPVGEVLLGEAEGVRLVGTLVHDLARRTSRYRRRFAGSGWDFEDEIVLRSFGRGELGTLLEAAGFVATRWWAEGATVRATAVLRPF